VGPFEPWFRVFWIMAFAAALMTAFYMTRLMVMTFHGENRTGAGERKHLHEVSPVMWVPLAVLAVLSIFGGWINVPEPIAHMPVLGWLPSSEWLHHWLHPVVEAADHVFEVNIGELAHAAPVGGGEAFWAAVSFLFATAVIAVTAWVLMKRRYAPADQSPAPRGFARVAPSGPRFLSRTRWPRSQTRRAIKVANAPLAIVAFFMNQRGKRTGDW
jgi:NADH:ubiquinone oxidoreductase subunit 5 (subunit L)/multisubunit Na+/H+ antiporter MnhA subunit